MSNENSKKALKIAYNVISWIIIAVTVVMMVFTIFSTLTFDKNDSTPFGFRFYIVLSDSMSLSENNKDDEVHFNAGDLIISKVVDDPTALEPGTIISFVSQNRDSVGQTITHKIRDRRVTDNGKLIGYITYGTNTGKNDESLVQPEFVLGEYVGKAPVIGHFFSFLKTTPGYLLCILLPFLLLILWQGVNTVRLFRQYKKEQVAEMEAERAQIAKEREESAQMMKELLALREQLEKQKLTEESAAPAQDSEAEAASDEEGASE